MSTIASRGRIAAVTCLESLRLSADEVAAWNELAANVPFRRFEWCEAWWRHYAKPGDRLSVLLVRDRAGRLIGIAPWYLETTWRHGRVLRFLGAGEVCSDYLTVLTAAGCQATVARALTSWLQADAAPRWDSLQLEGVRQDDECCAALVEGLRGSGHAAIIHRSSNGWRAALPGTWSEFAAQFSKSPRRKFRRLQEQFDSGRARRRSVETADDLAEGFRIFADLHQRRRASLGEAGCFASPRFGPFHAEIAAKFFDQGLLRLTWVELDDRPVSVDYGFADGDAVYLYQSGFDPDAANESPGTLQLMASVQSAIADGRRHFDFLRGDEPYKASWKAEPLPLVEVRVAARHRQATVRHSAWLASRTARKLVRNGLHRLKRQIGPIKAADNTVAE